jgi:periplasmic protein TonB
MMPLSADDRRDLIRWVVCGVIVVLVHGGVAAAMVQWREPVEPAAPSAAIVVDLAPVPVSSEAEETDIPVGPDQVQAENQPENKAVEKPEEKVVERPDEKVEEKQEEKVVAELAPAPEVAVSPPTVEPNIEAEEVVKPPTPERKPPTPKREVRPPAPATTKPQASPIRTAALPAAPSVGNPSPINSNALPNWKSQVVGILQRNKRYPPEAQSRHEQGVAHLAFSIDRSGRVTSSRIVESSGSSALDAETLALVRRSSPFPPPPPQLTGGQISLTVPIRYNIR